MIDSRLFQDIATARLEQSAVLEDGAVFVRLADGRHEARLEPAQWRRIVESYRQTVETSRKQLHMLMLATIPLALAVLGIMSNVAPLEAALLRFDRTIPFVLPLLLTSGLPIWAIFRHSRTVQQALDRARAELLDHPRLPARHRPPPREARPIEKLAIFAIIPALMVQTWGTIDPDAYRNTPWTGTRLGFGSLLLLLVLCALIISRRRAGRLAAEEQTEAGSRRTAGIAARARGPSPSID